MTSVLLGAGGVLAALLCMYAYGYWRATRLPRNHPAQFLKGGQRARGDGKVVVCVGDSITHGRVGCDYVAMLRTRLADRGYTFINAGVNGELSYNVLQRLDDIVRCKPDFVTILIGTNDCNGSWNPAHADREVQAMGLPQRPTLEWYRDNLTRICTRLQAETAARIAVLSIPVLTEQADSPAFQASHRFAEAGREIAEAQGVAYLPLHEAMVAHLLAHPSAPTEAFDMRRRLIERTIVRRYFAGQDWDAIAQAYGFTLLTDFIHLNCTGARMVAQHIEDFLRTT